MVNFAQFCPPLPSPPAPPSAGPPETGTRTWQPDRRRGGGTNLGHGMLPAAAGHYDLKNLSPGFATALLYAIALAPAFNLAIAFAFAIAFCCLILRLHLHLRLPFAEASPLRNPLSKPNVCPHPCLVGSRAAPGLAS